MSEYLLELKNIEKEYYGNKVLKGVSINIKAGEIHALLGENGAGKSTLMNILFGMEVIHSTGGFSGEVVLGGETLNVKSPKEAMEKGIGMVHQEFMLIPGFSILENVKLNRETTYKNPASLVFGKKLESLDIKSMKKDTIEALKKLDIDIDENTLIKSLPVGFMQFVEIAREIDKENIKVLVFDEPTAVLSETEAENLLKTMKKLAKMGIAIIFITHRLDEVMEICDSATILRDGEQVESVMIKDTSTISIAEKMVGRKVEIIAKDKKESTSSENILEIKDLHVNMPGEVVKGLDLTIKKGEIFGFCGLAGQGKIGIANGLMGLYEATGEVIFENEPLKLNDINESLNRKISFVSEDRKVVGLVLDESIKLNIAFNNMVQKDEFLKKYGFFTLFDNKKATECANKMIKDLDIRCTGPNQHTGRLSGGNQQKVCIGAALNQNPNLLFISEPTRGIDIGAKKLVLDLLVKLNRELGMTIVITSSELAEVRSIADRIGVIDSGKLAGILEPDANDADFGLLMAGGRKKDGGVE